LALRERPEVDVEGEVSTSAASDENWRKAQVVRRVERARCRSRALTRSPAATG
jgi:hypothetical protein